MKYSWDHIHFRCSDSEESNSYYQKMFDAKEVGRGDAKGMPLIALEMAGALRRRQFHYESVIT